MQILKVDDEGKGQGRPLVPLKGETNWTQVLIKS